MVKEFCAFTILILAILVKNPDAPAVQSAYSLIVVYAELLHAIKRVRMKISPDAVKILFAFCLTVCVGADAISVSFIA